MPGLRTVVVGRPEVVERVRLLAACAGVRSESVSGLAIARSYTGAAQVLLLTAAEPPDPAADGPIVWVTSPGALCPRQGVETFCLPGEERSLLARLSVRAPRSERGHCIGVLGGCGGAGASTLAATLAWVATFGRYRQVARLIDADPAGGGVDLLLGAEGVAGLRWADLLGSSGQADGEQLERNLINLGQLRVLSFNRETADVDVKTARFALNALTDRVGPTVVDLGRGVGTLASATLPFVDALVLVTPARITALGACLATLARLTMAQPVQVIVRDPRPGGLRPAHIARVIGQPVAGTYHSERRVSRAIARGEPPWPGGSLSRLCRDLLAPALRPSQSR